MSKTQEKMEEAVPQSPSRGDMERTTQKLSPDQNVARLENAKTRPFERPEGQASAAGSDTVVDSAEKPFWFNSPRAMSPAVRGELTAYDADVPALAPGQVTDDPLVGTRIDHFEIRARLGQGGMGTVYLAHDLSLERPVALKILRPELSNDQSLVNRVVLEARAQARLQHPNVVSIYYIGRHEGAPFFAMEYVPGRSLEERLAERGPIPWAEALEYIIQTARALAAAFRRGIIHRDVKPSNLIECASEHRSGHRNEVKVADFGLAAQIGQREGSFAGSPHYASPEQMVGGVIDHRADIYSLGITFYQLVTARCPFEASTVSGLFKLHSTAMRPVVPETKAPTRVRQIILEMMDPNPARRPASYEDLLRRLEGARPRPAATGPLMARAAAFTFDIMALAVVVQLLARFARLPQQLSYEIGMGSFGLYYVISHRFWRGTLGKRLFNLRVEGRRQRPGWWTWVVRFGVEFWAPLVAILLIRLQFGAIDLDDVKNRMTAMVGMGEIPVLDSSLQAFLQTLAVPNVVLAFPWVGGFLFAFFDERRQALHDRAAGTWVVYRE